MDKIRFRFAVYILCVLSIMSVADLIAPNVQLRSFWDNLRAVATVPLWIAALCFFWPLWRLGTRLSEERQFRIAAENAPISLGLNRHPIGFQERDEEDES